MIFVDTNVFIIDLRYRRDEHFETNRRFLDWLKDRRDGVVSIVNLLEVAGILSFNLNPRQLRELVAHFPRRYGVRIVPELDWRGRFPSVPLAELMATISKKCALGDALVASEVERLASPVSRFVSWDAHHFEHLTVAASTPAEALEEQPGS